MKMDTLTLEAFRGIPGRLELDLSAPMTLIYAPNGTGKTSILDAAEWLLTGQVGRMRHTLEKAAKDLRCLFGPSPTRVEARIRNSKGNEKWLRREVKEDLSSQLFHGGEGAWRTYLRGHALKWLAPLAPRKSSGGRGANQDTADWLRATHFLEGPSLGFLIDSSPDAEKIKRLLFARLLGVGELESRSQLFVKLQRRLRTPYRRLEDEVTELEERRQVLRSRLEAASAPYDELVRRVEERLDRVATLLSADRHDDAKPQIQLAELTAEHKAAARRLDGDGELLGKLETGLPSRAEWRRKVIGDEAALEPLDEELREKEATLETVRARRDDAAERQKKFGLVQETLREIASEIDRVRGSLAEDLATWIEHRGSGDREEDPLPAELRAEAERMRGAREENEQRLAQQRRCLESLPQSRRDQAKLRRLEESIEEIQRKLQDEKARAEAEERLARLEAESEKLREDHGSLNAALERLRGLVREDSVAESDLCPLCGHAHGTSEALRKAIEATLAEEPEDQRGRARRLGEIGPEEAELREWLEDQERLASRQEDLFKQREAQAQVIEEARRKLDAAFAHVEEFIVDLESIELETSLRRLIEKDEAGAQDLLEKQEAFERLGGMEAQIALLETRLAALDPSEEAETSSPPERPDSEVWLRRLDILENEAQGRLAAAVKAEAHATTEKDRLKGEESELASTIETLGNRRDRLQEAMEATKKKLQELEEARERLGLAESGRPAEVLEKVRRRLTERRVTLEKADEILAESRSFLKEELPAKEDSKDLRDVEHQLEEARRRIDAISVWGTDLEAASTKLATSRAAYVRTQIEPLNEIISSLYRRTQGNEVIDRIETRSPEESDETTFEWRPKIGEKRLAIEHLSLGQRQDLALAVFLARARSLGGTYFLDEPLIHLDDLNRVALLDTMRVLTLDPSTDLRLVLTTASSQLADHFREKFYLVPWRDGVPPLRIYELEGNPRVGVEGKEKLLPEPPRVPRSARPSRHDMETES